MYTFCKQQAINVIRAHYNANKNEVRFVLKNKDEPGYYSIQVLDYYAKWQEVAQDIHGEFNIFFNHIAKRRPADEFKM